MAKIDAFFKLMRDQGASDLHLSSGCEPRLRMRGELAPIKYDVLDNRHLMELLTEITPEPRMKQFMETGDLDFAHELPTIGRFRGNYFRQIDGVSAVFRKIPDEIRSIEDYGLPTVLKRFCMLHQGLVLVTGPTGTGKTTTLASMIDYANRNRREHIITIEDPVEYRHKSASCIVNQREVHSHTESFTTALKASLREDPDIILVGELRDLETMSLAIEAACTGHLVLSTMHTADAAQTVNRMIDVFPSETKDQVRASLSQSLKGVIAQTLLKHLDGKNRVPAVEVLVGTPAVANLIREKKTYQIPSVIQTGGKLGMQSMDDALEALVIEKRIHPNDAFEHAGDKSRFAQYAPELAEQYDALVDGNRPVPV